MTISYTYASNYVRTLEQAIKLVEPNSVKYNNLVVEKNQAIKDMRRLSNNG